MTLSIDVSHEAGCTVARLARPQRRNAIDREMVDELHALCGRLEAEPEILVLIGSDDVFASGADIRQLRDRGAAEALEGINTEAFRRVAALPMPVIAALDGYALGGGAELAYAADFRIGTPRLKIGNPETSLGIIAAAGATWRLPALVGEALAKEMLLAGRVLGGDEALAAGLVTRLVEPEELRDAALALVVELLRSSADALIATKLALAAPADAHPRVDLEQQAVLFESPEKHRRMTAFLDRNRT